jgi:uncharacterized protein
MARSNTEILRDGYDAFARGDIPAVLDTFAEDITWHVPGRSPLSGDYRGHEEVVGFFTTAMELSGGTLRVELEELVGDGERIVALTTVSAERHGQAWSSPEIHVWHMRNGQTVEFREFQGDQGAEDDFWSS